MSLYQPRPVDFGAATACVSNGDETRRSEYRRWPRFGTRRFWRCAVLPPWSTIPRDEAKFRPCLTRCAGIGREAKPNGRPGRPSHPLRWISRDVLFHSPPGLLGGHGPSLASDLPDWTGRPASPLDHVEPFDPPNTVCLPSHRRLIWVLELSAIFRTGIRHRQHAGSCFQPLLSRLELSRGRHDRSPQGSHPGP